MSSWVDLEIPAGHKSRAADRRERWLQIILMLRDRWFAADFYAVAVLVNVGGYRRAGRFPVLAARWGWSFANCSTTSWCAFTVREEVAFGLENLGVSREVMLLCVSQVRPWPGLVYWLYCSPTRLPRLQQRLCVARCSSMRPKVSVPIS